MITLDKMKIIAPLECVTVIRQEAFESKIRNGVTISTSYTQTKPYMLYLEIDYEEQESVIEFSGKILGDRYPELINTDNIRECFEHINNMGLCQLNVDMILEYGRVCVIDITKDVHYADAANLSEWLRTHIVNHRKYLARNVSGNLIIEKNVKTRAYKRRLTVYDKEKEMQRADNQEFMASITDPARMLAHFNGKIRFEYNLNSMSAIRKVLKISDTSIHDIFSSAASPIYDFVNGIIVEDKGADSTLLSWSDRKKLAFLRDCDMDMPKVEAEIRKYVSGSHQLRTIGQYRELLSRLNEKGRDLKKTLLGLLLESIIIFPLLLPL